MTLMQLYVGTICLFLAPSLLWGQRNKGQPSNYLEKTKSANEIRQLDNKMDRLFYTLCGEFTNKRQATTAEDPGIAIEQEMIAIPIWTERKGEYWVYIGWFKHGQPERALAQCVFRLTKDSRDTFRLAQYSLPNPEGNNYYSLEWKKAHPFNDLRPKDLILPTGCDNLVVESEANVFQILGDEEPCERFVSDVIRFYDYESTYTPEVMNVFTKYYDENKNFIFGYPRPTGLEFVRVDKTMPTYASPEKRQAKNK